MEQVSSMLQHVLSPVTSVMVGLDFIVFANIVPWANRCLCKPWHK